MWTRNPRLAAAKLLFIYQCTNFLGIFFHLNACNRPFYAISQYRRVARQAVSTQLLRRSILYLYVCHGVSLCMQTRTDEKAYRHFSNKYKYAIKEGHIGLGFAYAPFCIPTKHVSRGKMCCFIARNVPFRKAIRYVLQSTDHQTFSQHTQYRNP